MMIRFAYPDMALLLAMSCLPVLAGAQNLDDSLRRCAQQSEPLQRLACFDAIVNTLPQIMADRFGMTADIKRKRDPVAAQQAQDEALAGKISELRQASHGEWIFTLDNRQVWVEAETRSAIQFAVGENVRVEHGAMGSLWLVADRHRKVRIKRLQ